jgi:WhiB family redox-sensing transcriptional regulator
LYLYGRPDTSLRTLVTLTERKALPVPMTRLLHRTTVRQIEIRARSADLARCADRGAPYIRLFFSDDPADVAEAKAMCASCVVRSRCLAGAIERREPVGVWGGELFVKGVIVAARPRRGRPRKAVHALCG